MTLEQFRRTHSPNTFGMWEETGEPGENPCRCGENIQSPHRQWPNQELIYFSHQQYSKMRLNEKTFIEDLLCCENAWDALLVGGEEEDVEGSHPGMHRSQPRPPLGYPAAHRDPQSCCSPHLKNEKKMLTYECPCICGHLSCNRR